MKSLYHGNRNKTIDMVQEELFYMESYILVYGEYLNAHTKVDCECLICGYTWMITSNALLCGSGCEYCCGSIKSSLEDLQKTVDNLGKDMVITGDYQNRNSLISCQCNLCGHFRTVKAGALLKGACPGCSKKIPWSIETIKEKLDKTNRDIELISKHYSNNKEMLDFKCKICYFEWKTSWSSVNKRYTGCSNCSKTGFKLLRPANLYYLRITDIDRVYYKIGISCKPTLKRYSRKESVKIEVLYQFTFQTGQEAWVAEQNVLNLFKNYSYNGPKILKSEGNTEIFTFDVLQMGHLTPMAVKDVS